MNPGDIVYHKATHKRCVISEPWNGGVRVTTEDGNSKVYEIPELWTETEWEQRNKNLIESLPE